MNKQNKNKLIDTEIRLLVTRREGGWGIGKISEGVTFMVMDGNKTYGGDHLVVYTDVKLRCCKPKTYIIISF